MRWVVGDIQGCAVEFERLLKKIRFDPSRDELWSVGDIVNRGPDSPAALRLWLDTGGRGVIGNHDIYALLAFADRTRRKLDTLRDLFDAPDAGELLAGLEKLPVLERLPGAAGGRDAWIVHAGVHPSWTDLAAVAARIHAGRNDAGWLESPDVAFATRVRCCDAAGTTVRYSGPPEGCPASFSPWDDFYRGEPLIVHGHWARRGFYRTERSLGLDSGCVYGGEMTAWCQEEDRVVTVPGTG
jgi:bis(5'-nucleosyl)-tetraphosphatase (symmetrical)